jgi:hypothetical protein
MSAGLPYLRSRGRRLVALLLPLLVVRALIPFGFMPVVAGGGMTIGFCPGEADLPPGIAAAHQSAAQHLDHHHAGHHSPGHPGDPGGAAHHAPCLFAASAAPAFAPALLALAVDDSHRIRPVQWVATRVFLPTILRAQSSRGPPLLS